MFSGFDSETIQFFLDIRFHNETGFMAAHREEYYQRVRAPFYELIEALAPCMLQINPEMEVRPHKCLSRINRDTRFSNDKSPYRDHLWLAFRQSGADKQGLPFYWFELGPDSLDWGLGIWGENREAMNALRKRILQEPEKIRHLLNKASYHGFQAGGEAFHRLALPPEVDERLIPLYRLRRIYLEKQRISFDWAFEKTLDERLARDFTALADFYRLLDECVKTGIDQPRAHGRMKTIGGFVEDF